ASFVNDFSWSSDSTAIIYTYNSLPSIIKSEMNIRIIAENGELDDPKTIFVGGVAPAFVGADKRIFFIDVNGENLSIVSTSLRGEDYLEEFQIRIQPKDGTVYRLLKHPTEEQLLLTISSNEQLLETMYISLEDKSALPLSVSASNVSWNNSGEIAYVAQGKNGDRQIWIRKSFESKTAQLTNEYDNWF
ncbi:hypothetical protein KKA01_00285, partial [Patescibacteria group bacterium]|nr:hypothetical protein [Patescibacteria group bacterium]